LAIIGWGNHEPVEAVRGIAVNGNPSTFFVNKFRKRRFVAADWSKRKLGLTMMPGRTDYYCSPDLPERPGQVSRQYEVTESIQDVQLASQRNWIEKNPIWVHRWTSNCYPQSKEFAEAVDDELQSALDGQMATESYGRAINRMYLSYSLSYSDPGVKQNHIILDDEGRFSTTELYKRLRTMYSAAEIKENGYYLRQRYEFGNFRKASGQIKVAIHFPKEFSMQSTATQKREFANHLTTALDGAIARIKKHKLNYDFDEMRSDFENIVRGWAR
jgi:hypothetical protein